ncbi:MAG: Smr/MutS family protein [Clostridia bacterium]|nr:Smr/MutS family protein [Clostridia bacterium]
MTAAVIQLDIHGMNRYQAKIAIDAALRRSKGVYRIRVIHGGNHNTVLRDMIAEEYASHPLVLRIERGTNAGQSDLVLREL